MAFHLPSSQRGARSLVAAVLKGVMASLSPEGTMTDEGLSASEKLVERWLQCMPLEREVEKQECLDAAQSLPPRELERRGLGLHKLYIASSETALFGRALLTLQLSGARPLPPTRLSSGTMVALR